MIKAVKNSISARSACVMTLSGLSNISKSSLCFLIYSKNKAQFAAKQKIRENQHPPSLNFNTLIDDKNHISHPETAIPITLEKSQPESLNRLKSIMLKGINARPAQASTSHHLITSPISSPKSLEEI